MALAVKERYATNPFMKDLLQQTKKGQTMKKYSPDGNKFMIVNTDNPTESATVTAFGTSEEVEMNRFVKLYVDGVGGIVGLKSAGKKVFRLLYLQIRGKEGRDRDEISLNYALLPEETRKTLSQATFYRGIRELIDQRFIAPTMAANIYYINPTYIFNGDRLVIMNQYLLKQEEETKENFKRLNKKVKNATTVNIPPEHPENQNDLFEGMKNEMKNQLADGRKYNPETGEILTDANDVQYVDGELFVSEPPDAEYETGVIVNAE